MALLPPFPLRVEAVVMYMALHYLEVTPDVYNSLRAEADSPRPAHYRKADGDGNADHPEPEERIDLLVEEVDRQDTL